jgi:hypothetical protein
LPLFLSSYCPLYTLSFFRVFSFLCIIYFILSHSLVLLHFSLFNCTFISHSFSLSLYIFFFRLSFSFISPSFYFSFFLISFSFHYICRSFSLLPV